MKRKSAVFFLLVFVAVLATSLFGCGKGEENVIKIVVPDGAPALSVAKMMDSFDYDGYKTEYEIVEGTNVAVKMSSGEADIAIMPTNLAAKLYNGGEEIYTIAANVFGLLYLVGTAPIQDIVGETILVTGQGGTPDFVSRYILGQKYSIDENDIRYISAGSEAIAALNAGTAKYAVLGEPAATMAASKAGASILMNFQEEWETFTGYDGYPQACTVITKEVMERHSGFLKAFLKEMRANVDWIEENTERANEVLKAHGSTSNFASAAVVERCNIRYVGALEAKDSIEEYLGIMKTFNANFVGSELPNAGFYAGMTLD